MNLIKRITRKLRDYYIRKRLNLVTNIHIDQEWFGSNYGGFFIHPNIVPDNAIIYSFGLGEDISFDLQLIDRFSAHVYAFDPTPKSIAWVEKQELPKTFFFNPYGIGLKTGHQTFFLPKNNNYVSGSLVIHENLDNENSIDVPIRSFQDILKEKGHKQIDILKLDIEGSEYEVIPTLLGSNITISQVIFEIHPTMVGNGIKKTEELLELMSNHGYKLFGLSSTVKELSFIIKK